MADYPDTRPWFMPVGLSDAAHLVLREPVYVCSHGDLWIATARADPLPIVLARAATESEHLIDRPIQYVIWTVDRKGNPQASAVCETSDGYEIVSANAAQAIPWHRAYRWDTALTWDDGGITRLIVPTYAGVSIITVGTTLTEDYCPLLQGSGTTQPDAAPAVLFDLRGLLAWIPAGQSVPENSRVARFVEGKWTYLDTSAWPANIVHLIPMLDGSVLQIRRGEQPGSAELMIVGLDSPAIDEKAVSDLVDQLSDDDPDKRTAAYQQLTQYGPGIYSLLEKLSSDAAPEAQVRIRQLLQGRLNISLGGMLLNGGQLTVAARLPDMGVVFYTPQGVSIPQPDQDPKVVTPDYLSVRPGRPVQELPAGIIDHLVKNGGTITGIRDEWIINSEDVGPARYLPPNEFDPLLRPSERNFSRLIAIDGRGRWVFRDDASKRTLILDPTVPDPTPRLAIWLIDTGNGAGWTRADWPVIQRGSAHLFISDTDWQAMGAGEPMLTEPAKIAAPPPAATEPATLPDTTIANGPLLMIDAVGNRYYDGEMTLTIVTPAGRRRVWTLPDQCAGSADQPAYLVDDRRGHLFLFNSVGRIAQLRTTFDQPQPFALQSVFSEGIPEFRDVKRIWCDPAGRIDVVYEGSHAALIFPTGQVPPDIEDKILPQDLRRIDAP
jgi:hypothetical protein